MKKKTLILIVLCFALFVSCSKKKTDYQATQSMSYSIMEMRSPPQPPPPPSVKEGQYNPKLIKRGDMTISTFNIESTKNQIYRFLNECNGYVESESLEKNENESHFNLNLNIQAVYFDRFVQLIDSANLDVVSRSFSVEDVTLAYIDDSTRLVNKKKLEKRYLEILAKAQDIKEMLQIEEKLEEIRTDAEVRSAQLKVMEKQIAYSEFVMKIEKNNHYVSQAQKDKYSYKISQGIGKGWEGIKSIFVFLVSVWPVYLIMLLFYFLVKFIMKILIKNREKTTT